MRIEILGIPIAKARARIVKRGNFSMAYDPQEKEKSKFRSDLIEQIRLIGKDATQETHAEIVKLACGEAFNIHIESYMPIPKSLSMKKKRALAGDCVYHNKKPDLDNLAKFIFDCANGVLFPDDSMIVKGSFVKKYSDNPRTVININPININGESI